MVAVRAGLGALELPPHATAATAMDVETRSAARTNNLRNFLILQSAICNLQSAIPYVVPGRTLTLR